VRALLRSPGAGAALACVAAAALAGFLASESLLDRLSLWLIHGILALSLVLVWGRGGIFSLGQSGLYGLAGYAYGVTAVNLLTSDWALPVGLIAGAVVAALGAALIGYFMFYGRVSQINVAIITLATTLVLYALFNNTADPRWHVGDAVLGGSNGMLGIPPAEIGGAVLDKRQFYALVAVIAGLLAACVLLLLRRPIGRIAAAISSNELRAELLGYDVRAHRLRLFVIGAAIAGVAGGLFATWGSFIDPSVLALQPAILVAIWVLVGGRTRVAGAFVGALAVGAIDDQLGGAGGRYTPIYLGAVMIAIVLLFPSGLLGGIDRLRAVIAKRQPGGAQKPQALAPSAALLPVAPPTATLVAQAATKRFGGVEALADVDLELPSRGVHCLIGPNGAGKTTLFSLLSGAHKPTAGRVLLDGRDITRLPPHRRARLGIGVKVQGVSVFEELPARENLWLAAYPASASARAADSQAERLLEELGLSGVADLPAQALSHGQRQWLEIGMVVARRPSVVLLDEPTAGMSVEETRHTVELVQRLGARTCVVVIEHDMSFIRALEAPVTVLHLGRVLTRGSLAQIERDDSVLDVYLGRQHAPA
jgi:branched-chain amino acid transport system permease protein